MESNKDNKDKFVRVGVGVLIIKDNKVLFGQRKGAHEAGTWCPPGGKLDFGETFEECAKRETFEETGVQIKNLKHIGTTNDIFEKENQHYITIIMKAELESGIPRLMEPNKSNGWEWFKFDKLPENLFLPMKNFLKNNKIE